MTNPDPFACACDPDSPMCACLPSRERGMPTQRTRPRLLRRGITRRRRMTTTRTELIPCPTCGVARPIQVRSASQRRTATKRLCRSCANRKPTAFTPYTTNINCPQCGNPRPLRIYAPGELTKAQQRICRPCVTTNNTSTTPEVADAAAVERLLAGQPVHARAADRAQAVAYLTRRQLSAAEIARRIGCTKRTVERHRQRLAS
jgi:DNA-binding CsgD family transcriptional regulator